MTINHKKKQAKKILSRYRRKEQVYFNILQRKIQREEKNEGCIILIFLNILLCHSIGCLRCLTNRNEKGKIKKKQLVLSAMLYLNQHRIRKKNVII